MRKSSADWVVGEEVRRLHARGLSANQIAGQLGISARSVQRWRVRLGVSAKPGQKLTPVWHEQVVALGKEGYPASEIARLTGTSVHTVVRHHPEVSWSPQQAADYARMQRQLARLKWVPNHGGRNTDPPPRKETPDGEVLPDIRCAVPEGAAPALARR